MTVAGLIVALVAGIWLITRWSPADGPAEAPRSRPAETIDRAREAVKQFDAGQNQRQDQLRELQ
jgi:hypothetical protein